MKKKKMSKISFRARKKRSVEILVSNIYFLFTQDIYKQFATRIRSKAHETMEKKNCLKYTIILFLLGPKLTKPWRKNCLKYTILYKFRLYRFFTIYTFSDSARNLVNYEV